MISVLIQSLDPGLVAQLRELNSLDGLLYDAAVRLFDAALDEARGEAGSDTRAAWDSDAQELRSMQAALAATLEGPQDTEACAQVKQWFTMSDVEYEARPGRVC